MLASSKPRTFRVLSPDNLAQDSLIRPAQSKGDKEHSPPEHHVKFVVDAQVSDRGSVSSVHPPLEIVVCVTNSRPSFVQDTANSSNNMLAGNGQHGGHSAYETRTGCSRGLRRCPRYNVRESISRVARRPSYHLDVVKTSNEVLQALFGKDGDGQYLKSSALVPAGGSLVFPTGWHLQLSGSRAYARFSMQRQSTTLHAY